MTTCLTLGWRDPAGAGAKAGAPEEEKGPQGRGLAISISRIPIKMCRSRKASWLRMPTATRFAGVSIAREDVAMSNVASSMFVSVVFQERMLITIAPW